MNSLVGNDYTEVLTLTREEKDKQREEEKEREEAKATHLVDTAPPTKKRRFKGKKRTELCEKMSQTLNFAFYVEVQCYKLFYSGSIAYRGLYHASFLAMDDAYMKSRALAV